MKIDLHHELYTFRQELVRKKVVPLSKRVGMAVLAFVLERPCALPARGEADSLDCSAAAPSRLYGPWNPWGIHRELPPMPQESFRELLKREPPPARGGLAELAEGNKGADVNTVKPFLTTCAARRRHFRRCRSTPTAITTKIPRRSFETFAAVGGTFVRVADLIEPDAELRKLELYTRARKIVSLVPGAGTSNVDVSAMRNRTNSWASTWPFWAGNSEWRKMALSGYQEKPRAAEGDLRDHRTPCVGRSRGPACPHHARRL